MNTQIFEQIRQLKRQIMPNEKVILFGSQARGDAHPNSDWDLLVLLNKPKEELSDYENFAYPFVEFGCYNGADINPKLYTKTEWEQGKAFPFYKNVMREGIEIN
ncbi:MAG: nucleotidyltransferase domain-containing protein [Bacteroidales bacterium]|nr:nucleotidyltransferase domain-containing protein [Bacteroidales bacterium]